MNIFQQISITYLALYVSSVYWHPQNVLDNKYKCVTYLCIQMYVWMCDMNTRIFKHTYVSIYRIITIKFYCKCSREFYWYSIVKCADWIYFLIYCFICFIVFKKRKSFPTSHFCTHSVYLYVCVCVCSKEKCFCCAVWCQLFQILRITSWKR